jgi:hypothetical protein
MDEIEKIFQQSDFSSESIGLETRIWNRITNFKEANMPIDKSKLTKEMIDRAAMCQTADELIALAKTSGIDITKAEAEAYLDELDNMELDTDTLAHVAGGKGCPTLGDGGLYK